MKPILVTCVYVGKSDWLMGGKDNDEGLYELSLKNLANFDMPMHLYCWPWMVDFMTEMCGKYFKEFKIIGCDLFEWPRSYELVENKNKFVWYTNESGDDFMFCPRNELLCHWKYKWCKMAKDNEWGCDRVVWVDAGVAEWCKIPESMGGTEYLYNGSDEYERYGPDHWWPENKNNIFNPKFTEGLKRIWNDQDWFHIATIMYNDRLAEFDWPEYKNWTSKVLTEKYGWEKFGNSWPHQETRKKFKLSEKVIGIDKDEGKHEAGYPMWTLGTIFGGTFEMIDKLYEEYMELYHIFTDNKDLYPVTEEPIYSILAAEHDLNLFYFHTWSHDKEDEECCVQVSDKPFYSVITDIINYGLD